MAAARSFHPGIEVVCLAASWPTPRMRRIRRCIVLALSEIMHTLCAGRASLFSLSLSTLSHVVYARSVYMLAQQRLSIDPPPPPDAISANTTTSNHQADYPTDPASLSTIHPRSYIRAPTKCQHPKRAQPLNT